MLSTGATLESNSFIYLKVQMSDHPTQQVYQIQRIIESQNKALTFTVKRLQENISEEDPYSAYKLLRATIWSRQLSAETYSVRQENIRCHAAIWNYSPTHCIAIILDRVSLISSFERSN